MFASVEQIDGPALKAVIAMTTLLAAISPVAVAGASAVAFGLAGWLVASIAFGARSDEWSYFELDRRRLLRSKSLTYRRCEPLIDEMKALYADDRSAPALQRALGFVPGALPWTPAEFLAVTKLQAILLGLCVALATGPFLSWIGGVGLGLATYWIYARFAALSIIEKADQRLAAIKRRMPYAIDLIANMMQAGAGFRESLESIVRDNANHPFGEAFGDVLAEMRYGRELTGALEGLEQNLDDPDVSEFVFAVVAGEELGVPLSTTLRLQAEQLRLKRSQWAEKAAGEAQVKIVFPGFIIMLACLLIVVAPFMLKLLAAF